MRKLLLILLCALPALSATPATTGRTAWWNASDADHLFKTPGTPGTDNPASGETVRVWDDEDGLDLKLWAISGGVAPEYTTSGINSLGSLTFTPASADAMVATNDAANTQKAISSFIAASSFTMFAAIRVTGNCSNTGADYSETAVVVEKTYTRWGLMCTTVAGVTKVWARNYDGTSDAVGLTVAQNTDYVVMMRHGSGNMYASLNGGAESSTASGDTSGLTGIMGVGTNYNDSAAFPGWIGEIIIYNTALSGSDFTNTMTYMTDKWLPAAPASSRKRVMVVE